MANNVKVYPIHKPDYRIINKNILDGCAGGRRSGEDRRKKSSREYFVKGGIERRSWKERRMYWYMTL